MHDARDAEDNRLLEANDYPRLLAAYYPIILDRCKVLVRARESIEVAHAVVDRLLSELSRGKRYGVPFRVVVHKVIEWKVKEHFRRGPPEVGIDEWDAPLGDPTEAIVEHHYLESLFETLPERDAQVMRLRYLDLLDPSRIAAALGITTNAVHQALWRGHRALKGALGA